MIQNMIKGGGAGGIIDIIKEKLGMGPKKSPKVAPEEAAAAERVAGKKKKKKKGAGEVKNVAPLMYKQYIYIFYRFFLV